MGSRADEVEIFRALGAIVEAEPRRLAEQWRHGKPGTRHTEIVIGKVLGRHEKVGGDLIF